MSDEKIDPLRQTRKWWEFWKPNLSIEQRANIINACKTKREGHIEGETVLFEIESRAWFLKHCNEKMIRVKTYHKHTKDDLYWTEGNYIYVCPICFKANVPIELGIIECY